MLLGSRMQDRRNELMLSLEDIATFIGVRVETIDNWEHGISNPKKANLQALAKILQTTTDYLEGNTDIAIDYASGGNTCIICGKPIPYGVAKCPECCWRKWSQSALTSEEQSTRRKRSHSVNLAYLDRDKAMATFVSNTSWGQNTYTTTLDTCTCPDFEDRHMPCKHIFRLANELGLFQPEEFAAGEDDYTMHFEPTVDDISKLPNEDTSSSPEPYHDNVAEMSENSYAVPDAPANFPAVVVSPPKERSGTGIFSKLLKYVCCCFFGFIALTCIVGAFTQGKEWLCFPVGLAVAGLVTAIAAKHNTLEGSAFKWWLYGTLVPVVSWMEVVITNSQNKVKGFFKGLVYSTCGLLAFLAVFSCFLSPVQTKEVPAQNVAVVSGDITGAVSANETPAPKIENAVLPARSESSIATTAPSVPEPTSVASIPQKSKPETISVYLGENRVILDPNDNDDEEQVPRPSGRKSSKATVKAPAQQTVSGTGNVVITPKGKKYHYSWCRTVRGSYTALTVAQARKRGYKPCKICSPPSR